MNKQVERFYKKWSKQWQDEQALKEAELKRLREEKKEFDGIKGVNELAEQGSIKEAAAVFSYEGMQIFAELFAPKPAITLEDVERVVEKKMNEMLTGFMLGMGKYFTEQEEPKIPVPIVNVERVVPTEQPIEKDEPEELLKIDAEVMSEVLKEIGKPVKLSDIERYIHKLGFKMNPNATNDMSRFMRKDKNIRKFGYGMYYYHQEGLLNEDHRKPEISNNRRSSTTHTP